MEVTKNKIPVIAIVGPTASGKTALSIKIARKFNCEIISADSMQIYKEFKICTAKPKEDQLNSIKHYMIDEVSVLEDFSVAEYMDRAQIYAKKIEEKGKTPLIVGGTGLYIDSFLGNLNLEKKKTDPAIREKLIERVKQNKEELFIELKEIDPLSANKIHPNDIKRVVRALEFYYSFGYPISDQVKNSQNGTSPYKTLFIGLNFRDRKILYSIINDRVDIMLKSGLLQEIEEILKLNISETAKCAIGYKEIIPYLKGQCNLSDATEKLKKETRAYAKRQLTWFKRNKNINWLYIDDYTSFDELAFKACDIIKRSGIDEVY